MQRRKFVSLVIAILLALNCFGAVSVSAAEKQAETTAKHYNVMLVIDGSGSLMGGAGDGTDVQGYRYRALELFLGVLTNEGNRVGAIVFNHEAEMPLDTGLMDVPSMADKKNFAKKIENTGVQGDTDIGGALQRALEELQGQEAEEDIPSCIILFSDGETDLGNDTATYESLKKKDRAIQEAKKLGIPIHGICLNTNNSANTQEVKGIADGTGGFYQEIQSAADLDEAFLKFYSLIYGEAVIPGGEEESPIEKKFKIPSEGIVEVNILIQSTSQTKKIALTQPDGIAYSDAELEAASISTGSYDVIKIVNPDEGVWTLTIDDAPGTKIKFDWIYNTDLSAEIACETKEVTLDEETEIRGYLLSKGKRTDNEKVYKEYKGTLVLTNTETGESEKYPMETDGSSFDTKVKFPEYGVYEASIQLTCGDIVHTSEKTVINVGNEPPYAEKSVVKKSIALFPFGHAEGTIQLGEYITDPEGEELNYELGTYSYDVGKVTLENDVLQVDAEGANKGTVVVKAFDPQGASTEVSFEFSVRNYGKILAGIFILIVIIILIVLFIKDRRNKGAVFTGTVTVSSFDNVTGNSSQPWPQTGIRYKRNLRDWQVVECGIQGDFVARYAAGRKSVNGKRAVELYFVSKQEFETESGQQVKEYKFVYGDDIRFFAPAATENDHMMRGIRVIISENLGW